MNGPIRIGIDVDCVLAEFRSSFAQCAKDMFGKPENVNMPWTDWNMAERFGLTGHQYGQVWERVQSTPNWWEDRPEVEKNYGATEYLYLLTKDRVINPFFMTARKETKAGDPIAIQTSRWLQKHGFETPAVICASDKNLLAYALHLDAFLDDRFENCRDVKLAGVKKVFMQVEANSIQHIPECGVLGITPVANVYESIEMLVGRLRTDWNYQR